MIEPAVEARGLDKRYGRVTALDGIDLTIARGGIYGILGPSGAGKTTLVKCLGLVARPTRGSLRVLGSEASQQSRALRARIGYMPQEPALYEELSARFNIEFFGRGAAASRVDPLLEMLDLAGRARDPVRSLSGGMRQRVSLACALINDAELLLLDEPTAGIDPILRMAFWGEFRRLRDQGRTLIVSTHQIDEASHCDRLLVLRDGRVLIDCTPEQLSARGGATVSLRTKGGRQFVERLADPAHELLRRFSVWGPDGVEELRVRYDTLEETLVTLIRERENGTVNA